MFYYYGRKKRLASHYPLPSYDTIIEPFAGSAAYSLHGDNWKKNVIIIEKDAQIASIWRWLINEATPESITALPEAVVGEKTTDLLMMLHAASKMTFTYKTMKITKVVATNWETSKRMMAASIHKVKHWHIIEGDYTLAPDIEATWFIDPPYQGDAGTGYACSSSMIDYDALAAWSLSRKGQIICCEGGNASYLPFKPFQDMVGVAGKKNAELMYHRNDGLLERGLFG